MSEMSPNNAASRALECCVPTLCAIALAADRPNVDWAVGDRRAHVIPALWRRRKLEERPDDSGAITFSGTFSGTLVGARSGAGAGAGVWAGFGTVSAGLLIWGFGADVPPLPAALVRRGVSRNE